MVFIWVGVKSKVGKGIPFIAFYSNELPEALIWVYSNSFILERDVGLLFSLDIPLFYIARLNYFLFDIE